MAIDLRANEEKKTQCEVNLMNFYSFSESAIGWKKQHTHYKLNFYFLNVFWLCGYFLSIEYVRCHAQFIEWVIDEN